MDKNKYNDLKNSYSNFINHQKSKMSRINGYALPNGWNDLTTTNSLSVNDTVASCYYKSELHIKYLQLGNFKLAIKNYGNKLFVADSVRFSFISSNKGSKLNIDSYFDEIEFTSLNELKEYVNYLKITYNELKVVEKKLNINKDF